MLSFVVYIVQEVVVLIPLLHIALSKRNHRDGHHGTCQHRAEAQVDLHNGTPTPNDMM